MDSAKSAALPPLVSIIVRTLGDRQAFLREALASLERQGHPRIEVVLVLDRSDCDPTREAFRHWVDEIVAWNGEDLRAPSLPPLEFRPVYSGQRNRSIAANLGVLNASGELVGFLDDDDVLRPSHVEHLVRALQANPDAGLAYSDVEVVECDAANRPKPVNLLGQPRTVYAAPFTYEQLLESNRRPNNSYLVRRDLLHATRVRFSEDLPVVEDWDFLARLAQRFPFVHAPGITAEYRIRDDASNTSTRDRELVVLKTAELRTRLTR